ncbi:MAG TPA: IS30 family transposase [Streptosporangiaceae bacterium]
MPRTKAAAALGLNEDTGREWFMQAGGVIPAYVAAQASGRYLSIGEREEIYGGIERRETIRQIARRLNRAPSTVSRELRRNMRQSYRGGCPAGGQPATGAWDYRPRLAGDRAERRAKRPKLAKLVRQPWLRELVQAGLKLRYSPQQVAATLRAGFPDNPEMWVSHETIYQSIYVQGRGALRRELASYLRMRRNGVRRLRARSNQRHSRIPDMVNISERPAEANDRAVPGHWEGDIIFGKDTKTAIGTLVERTTRFVMLLHLPNGHRPRDVEEAMLAATKRLPDLLWKSLTWDQGMEMRNHAQIKIASGLQVYFCDPGKPWQRGSNENTNGLLRQYFPKGSDLSVHGPDYLEFVADQINHRPRQTLGWERPVHALARLISEASPSTGVASTT